ncbi:outer membrane beta-barrel protein [Dysgonomonas macrotermitis]|uniref:Outer membrane receptor proteins, mostly Fe transport n=1 Tax=Dysgonomonas macrotermitis TaxID=1346286 RepID=A0A1M4ZXZ4_9BACT|nr:outer membrane beta-barrel protein [Dysgonomonas macrotermitis]SHF22953.1 Outer membrane receptor proteins, mostly Fe transport [Dysgonomonas macrotermitis]
MKKFLFLLIVLLYTITSYAIDIKGRIIDFDTRNPIEFASIALLKNDSTFVSGSQSGENGSFLIAGNYPQADYLLKITYLGYNTSIVRIGNLKDNIQLGDMDLTNASHSIKEVTVTANRIINKVDRQIILPSEMEVKSSVNGFDLLNRISLPGLSIDPVNRTISALGEDVQLRINGIKVTLQEVLALRAEDISRVEYFDEPGVRFGNENVGAILNLIVLRKRNSGGYISLDGRNAPFIEFGDDQISMKANYKASEFALNYSISYRGYDKRWTDMTESYNFPENQINRIRKGEEQPMHYQEHYFNLTYNLTQPDKYVFNIALKDEILNRNYANASNSYYTNSQDETYIYSKGSPYSNSPVLDIYYRQELKNKQSLTFNAVGTYINSDSESWYDETENSEILSSIYNRVKGKKHSIIGEILYNKEFDKMTFTAGGKHTQGYTDNKYTGTNNSTTSMQNADSYIYAQIQGKIKDKLGYTLGLGGSRVWFKEDGEDMTYYLLRPSLQLSYPVNNNLNIKYTFNVSTSTPSLGQLSNVEQQTDRFVTSRGNPNLKPYNTYRNRFTFSYNKGIVNTELTLTHAYMHKPFMSIFELENDKVISYTDNYKSFQQLGGYLDTYVKIIKDIWTINGWIGSYRFESKSNSDSYGYSNLYGGLQSNLIYKNYTLVCGFNSRYNNLWGQRINYGEKWSYVEAGYKYNDAKIAIGMSLPFDEYWSAGSKNLSDIAPSKSWSYIKENGQMLYLRFSWNISFGRKHDAGQKKLNNSDSDSGILR